MIQCGLGHIRISRALPMPLPPLAPTHDLPLSTRRGRRAKTEDERATQFGARGGVGGSSVDSLEAEWDLTHHSIHVEITRGMPLDQFLSRESSVCDSDPLVTHNEMTLCASARQQLIKLR